MKKLLLVTGILSLSVLALAGCSGANGIKAGDTVSIGYTATFKDGKVFDTKDATTPLVFTVGSGTVIAGLDKGVIGMSVGGTKTITVTSDKGYGKDYDLNKLQKISKFIFDKLSIAPKNGGLQKLGDIEGVVKGTEGIGSGELVLFDINPRQTRDTLIYKVTVLTKN